jgi:hypothetical protein
MSALHRVDFSKLPGQVADVIDYLVVIDDGRNRSAGKPAGGKGPLDVGHGVVLRRLHIDMGERLLTASHKRGENLEPSVLYDAAHALTRAAS